MARYTRPHSDTYADLALALRRRTARDNLPCWICKQPIDTTLDRKHPMSFTYDHIEPLAAGGDPRGPGRPAHLSCNSRRSDGRNTIEHVTVSNTSIDWLAGPPNGANRAD